MTPPTPENKLFIAKMMSELIGSYYCGRIVALKEIPSASFNDNFYWIESATKIPEESWPYIMQLAEEKLFKTYHQWQEYAQELLKIEPDKEYSVWFAIAATFNQRATAMRRVKGEVR